MAAVTIMRKETILVVDDEPTLRRSLEKMLLRVGYVVHTASNPEEAKHVLQSNEIDLAILDIVMPNWTGELSQTAGIDLLDEITKGCSQTKVIMLTANRTVETAVKAMKLGALDYIIKSDIGSKSFLKMVEEALKASTSAPSQQWASSQINHAKNLAQPRTSKGWLKERVSGVTEQIIASLLLSILVFAFGKIVGILEGGLANWLTRAQSIWYLIVGFALVIVIVAAYVYRQRKF